MNIRQLAEVKLALAAYSQFLGEKGVVFSYSESPKVPDIPALEAEFMDNLLTKILASEPCTDHKLILVEATMCLRHKLYVCHKCGHTEVKES